MERILVTGSEGQLGLEIKDLLKDANIINKDFIFTDIKELDITNKDILKNYLIDNKINILINCSAYTAVDKAESEPDLVNNVNSIAVLNIAKLCKELRVKLIHISTDFVFDGKANTPYVETYKTNPISIYGKSKELAEKHIQKESPTYIIIRTSWLYSYYGNNFVKTILRLSKERKEIRVVFDQIGTPTYAKDLATVILKFLDDFKTDTREIFHYSNEGVASWYDFAEEIVTSFNNTDICKVVPILSKEYITPAQRPNYSVMDKNKIKKYLNIEIPYWKKSLKKCLERFV